MDLQNLWFVLIVVLWSGYFLLEGFDFGVGMLLPFLPRDDEERSAMFASIGPVWDGNEVWLVTAGGATFAAFPAWYATMFSGLYIALLALLFFLIIRVISFEWRSKSESPAWRKVWLWANAVGSFGASLIWGVGFANLLYGMPINSSGDFDGTFWDLFNGYTVVAGLAVVAIFAFHGATFLTLRTQGDLLERAGRAARRLSLVAAALGAGFLIWTVVVAVDRNDKNVFPPVLPAVIGIAALLLAVVFVHRRRQIWAFTMTGLGAIAVIVTLFTSLFPRVIVSSTDFANSLTISNSASQHYTLAVMTVVGARLHPARHALPGLDLPRLPRPRRRAPRRANLKLSALRPVSSSGRLIALVVVFLALTAAFAAPVGASTSVPRVYNHSYTISADVHIPEGGAEGVIVADASHRVPPGVRGGTADRRRERRADLRGG